MINHLWLICACTPSWSNAPANLGIQMDAQGIVVKDGSVTPDGYVVHTVYPANRPYPGNIADPAQLMPLPPIVAASSREAPSSTAAIANSRRACAASFARWAKRRTSPAVYSVRTAMAWPMANPLSLLLSGLVLLLHPRGSLTVSYPP